MPWKKPDETEQRWEFLQRVLRAPPNSFAAICCEFGISRKTGYKWVERWRHSGRTGLANRDRRARRAGRGWARAWRVRALALQRRHRGVGARKVCALLRQAWPRRRLPAERTIHRWLREAGRVQPPARRSAPGPWQRAATAVVARRPNDVWTIDFKGRFRTGDGVQVQPLTVRDLVSRYLLGVRHLACPDERSVARYCRRLFARHGVPKAMRMDQGAPFSSDGPQHWTRLSVGWLRRGIAVQITRRARPQDNGAHEQMHRMLKADTAKPPAPTLAAQQRRFDRWRRWYNEQRPHEALGQRAPAQWYRDSPRPLSRQLAPLVYPASWLTLRVTRAGYIRWQGQLRGIGRAFYGQTIALRPRRRGVRVYLGPHLLGTLFPSDHALRIVRVRARTAG